MPSATAAALAELLLPPLSGLVIAAWLTRYQGRVFTALRGALVAGVVLATFAVMNARKWGFYDAGLVAALFVGGFAVGGFAVRGGARARRSLGVGGVACALSLATLEVCAARLPRPPGRRPAAVALVELTPVGGGDPRCGLFSLLQDHALRPAPGGAGGPSVLLVGDSMVAALDVPEETRFTTRLVHDHPEVPFVVAAVPGLGPDAYLALLRAQLPVVRPGRVVLHIYTGNDLYDVDRPYPCCDGESLLGATSAGLPLRCSAPSYRVGPRLWVTVSPPPLALRWLATVSQAAWRLDAIAERSVAPPSMPWSPADWVGTAGQRARLADILRGISALAAAQNVRLDVVLLPPRWPIEGRESVSPIARNHAAVRAIAERAHLRVHDAWPLFAEAFARDPSRDWFYAGSSGNPHLGVAGHALYARWLWEEVLR